MSNVKSYRDSSDSELVHCSVSGEHAAFAEIIHRYQGLISGLTYSRSGRLAQSEDLAQETFLVAWQRLASLENPERLAAWLCGIARNVLRATARKKTEEPTEKVEAIPSVQASPVEVAISNEQEGLLWQSLERIPAKHREVMILYYRQDKSIEDVSRALELSNAAVRKRLERARAMLREDMAAVIEGTLEETKPKSRFASAVLAALPVAKGKASLAAAGSGGATSMSTTGGLSTVVGPFIGMMGAIYGAANTLRSARSPRERQFVWRFIGIVGLCVAVFGLAMLAVMYFIRRPYLWFGVGALCAVYGACLLLLIRYFNRTQQEIRFEEDTDGPRAGQPTSARALWQSPLHVYGVLGGSTAGAIAWMVVMAAQARDWPWAIGMPLLALAVVISCARRTLRQGAAASASATVCVILTSAALTLVAVNWRFHTWLANGAESRLDFAGLKLPADNPWLINGVFVALYGLLLAIIPRKLARAKSLDSPDDNESDRSQSNRSSDESLPKSGATV